MSPKFASVTPTLRIFDVRKAREFYLDFLGFKIDFEHRFEPDVPLYMGLSLGSAVLHLSEQIRRLLARRTDHHRDDGACGLSGWAAC